MTKAYIICNSKGTPVPKTKVYPTERGAKLGYRYFIKNMVQEHYLYKKDKDAYGKYLDHYGYALHIDTGTMTGTFGPARHVQEVADYEQAMREEYSFKEIEYE